ncbi:hypothetical protein V1477_015820 [Vespula maculifrons]
MAILYKLAQGLPERNSITAVECLDERSKRNAHPETGLLKLLWEKPLGGSLRPLGAPCVIEIEFSTCPLWSSTKKF